MALGLFFGGLAGFRGVCANPFGYCINDAVLSDYPELWIGLGGVIAAMGGALVGSVRRGKSHSIE